MTTENIGFLASEVKEYTIVQGTDGSGGSGVDLGRNYSLFLIRCENCTNIPDSTTMSILTKVKHDDNFTDLYELNDPSTKWSKGVPTTGTLQFILSHALGARWIKLDLSANASGGDVVFEIYGLDPIIFE